MDIKVTSDWTFDSDYKRGFARTSDPRVLAVIERDDCRVSQRRRIEEGDQAFMAMSAAWSAALRDSFVNIQI